MTFEGFFAFVWFGWGQAAPPSWLVAPLAVGADVYDLRGITDTLARALGGPPFSFTVQLPAVPVTLTVT